MRYALLDNSTITAIQRLLGNITIKNKATIDMDILAFESYITAILFYDDIICIDDYKEQHKACRADFFPEIRFINKSLFDYDKIEERSIGMYNEIKPAIKQGEIDDSYFTRYFELLKMHMIFTWDMSSSEYFLTQKVLLEESGIDTETSSKLMSGIMSEAFLGYNLQSSPEVSIDETKFKILDSFGEIDYAREPYKSNNIRGLSNPFQLFATSLAWLAQRTIFYTLVAEYLQADLFLHPIRQSFNIVVLGKKASLQHSQLKPLIDEMNSAAESTIKDIKSITEPFISSYAVPLFCAWIVSKTKDPTKAISLAYDLRKEKVFVDARNKMRELNQLIESKDAGKLAKEFNTLNTDLKSLFNKLRTKYGLGADQGISTSKIISLYNNTAGLYSNIKLPSFDLRIKQLEFLKHIGTGRGFKGVYRNLINDLVGISRLGEYHDLLTRNISLHREAQFYKAKTEEIEYLGKKSNWKIPMN